MHNELLQVEGLSKHFASRSGTTRAVENVSFSIRQGETLGIVGESGCGKSTLGRMLIRLVEPSAGRITFDGADISAMSPRELRGMRRRFQMVFQDPQSSLNPRMTVQRILEEPLRTQGVARDDRRKRVKELADQVGLPAGALQRYAHEFSGGQRQRIGIARALALKPDFIVADEPVAALDVSIQAQILNLMIDLKKEYGLTYLFIAHDLSVVEYISDRVGVMYFGNLVELADSDALYREPLHPYTQHLLSAVPVPDPDRRTEREALQGEPPDPTAQPAGCCFRARCPLRIERCAHEEPALREVRTRHWVACHVARTSA